MNILVTGSKGFIGKNLISALHNISKGMDPSCGLPTDLTVFAYDKDAEHGQLDDYCKRADFVFHLAGVNRPENPEEYMKGNRDFLFRLLCTLKKYHNTCPVMYASSIQAVLDNPYGVSKREAEKLLCAYGKEVGSQVYIYRFSNVFGKWCRPDYNSVIATFCRNIAEDMPIIIHDPDTKLTLNYIDDVIIELLGALRGCPHKNEEGVCYVPTEYQSTVGEAAELIYSFYHSRKENMIPKMEKGSFESKMYATYLSYLPAEKIACSPHMHVDSRGFFTELFRTPDRGQVSVNIINPGITKGNHWHHTKNEKFAVVSGKGLIQLRKLGMDENGKPYPVIRYEVSGEHIIVIDMIPGYTHSITNLSDTDKLVTMIWANELYDPEHPDTYKEMV